MGKWIVILDVLRGQGSAQLFEGLVCVDYELLSYDAFYAVFYIFVCAFCCG